MKSAMTWFLTVCLGVGVYSMLRAKPERTISEQLIPLATAAQAEAPTSTPQPTATVGYQATAVYAQAAASTAQANADAANRLLVEATAQEDARRHEELSWTATADGYVRQSQQETAIAAPTYVPATQTQGVIYQGIIATNQSINMTAQAMTQSAPTMLVAMARAEQQAKLAPLNAWIVVFGLLVSGIFVLALAWFLWHSTQETKPAPRPAFGSEVQTVITLHRPDPVYPSAEQMIIPCSREQLTALASGLLREGKTLAINQWERKGDPFTRQSFSQVRSFLLSHKPRYALSAGGGQLALTPEGEQFLRDWLEQGALPPLAEFMPLSAEPTAEPTHMSVNHAYEPVGEGVGG